MISGITYNNSKHSLVFDDGGFIFSNPDNSGFKLNYEVYNRILELAKSQANLPCFDVQIFTPKEAPFFKELWLGIFLSIHIKISGGFIDNEQKLETVNPLSLPSFSKVINVTPEANLFINSLKVSSVMAMIVQKEQSICSNL